MGAFETSIKSFFSFDNHLSMTRPAV